MFLFLCAMLTPLVVAADDADAVFDPPAILLTWQQDPTTTMTIDWHTVVGEQRPRASVLEYKRQGDDEWTEVPGTTEAFPYVERTIHRVELTGLDPDTTYRFRFPYDPAAARRIDDPPGSAAYEFRTMPADLSEPVSFAVGGDTGSGEGWRSVAAELREHDVAFFAIGGDLAYADGGMRDYYRDEDGASRVRWIDWFDIVKDELITEEGRVIPILAGIGNHEVRTGYWDRDYYAGYEPTDVWRERIAPIYYNIFAFTGQPGYAALDFGDYLSLIFLDSLHTNPVDGEQAAWLEQTLAERAGRVPHVFPIYHIPAYPSYRNMGGRRRTVRQAWTPLFDRHGIEIAFENHDHAYKRTPPIRGEEIHPDGVVYIGDGAAGALRALDRLHDPEESWWLDRVESERHFILVTLDEAGRQLEMINDDGEVFDRYPEPETDHERTQ